MIGNNCVIGDNVTIRNSIIWETVTIADNCHIENALICENVIIGEGAKILSGAMIDKGVHIKPQSEIIKHQVVSALEIIHVGGK